MSESLTVTLALLAGVLLGMIFFGGLWWTIQRGISSKQPAVLFSGSFLLRTFIVLAGLYYVSHGDWRKLLACMLGFLFARILVTRLTRLQIEKKTKIIEEGGL